MVAFSSHFSKMSLQGRAKVDQKIENLKIFHPIKIRALNSFTEE